MILLFLKPADAVWAQKGGDKPRILISTDIGGSDPDDNQSMTHLMMYSDRFEIEGLVSSPSYGGGSKKELLRMIDLYEKDYPKLAAHNASLNKPAYLRSVCKEGYRGIAPFSGFSKPTEGSEWIVKCARKKSSKKLWVLVWGGLEDVAQALHDAPDIKDKIRVYWIGGPNKKWGANSYSYIASNFPDLFFIENNASYRGFFSNKGSSPAFNSNNYFARYIQSAGNLGDDFDDNHYKGNVKMGDTPSLLYMMDGDPENPLKDSWGGRFERFNSSPRFVYNRTTSLKDTAHVYAILEFHFKGPAADIPVGASCFDMTISSSFGSNTWQGYYLGNGDYAIKYAHKQAETFIYKLSSKIPALDGIEGALVVDNQWPGAATPDGYRLGSNWYTDISSPDAFESGWQGAKTVRDHREEVLADWAKRWEWLR